MDSLLLYHTGYDIIREPDIHHGRKNADFGQGFYLTLDHEFAYTWAREHKDQKVYVNRYVLDLDGLAVKTLERNADWYRYIFHNRQGYGDDYAEADIIRGPIANDTIFDVFGIVTSGFLTEEEALDVLLNGPCYEQVVLKSEKASQQLHWQDAEEIPLDVLRANRVRIQQEEEAFQKAAARILG